jgi:ABC-type nitrate/sulfonate/bicarbonate transport system permease component
MATFIKFPNKNTADTDKESAHPRAIRQILRQGIPFYVCMLAIIAWEFASQAGSINALFFPAPSHIGRTFLNMIVSGELLLAIIPTIERAGLGLLAGGSVGMLAGIALGSSRALRQMLDPWISFFYPLPKIALFPLMLMIFGLGETSRVVLIALAAFFPLLINTMTGIHQINEEYFEVAQSYRASRMLTLKRIILPGSLPTALSGLRLSVGMALTTTIAVELLNSSNGIGSVIWLSWETLHTDALYIALLVTALLGLGSHLALEYLGRILFPWQKQRGEAGQPNLVYEI